ncbi:MAG: hypothetical protein ACRDL7_14825, partial [Gaiellaceae bacterium]
PGRQPKVRPLQIERVSSKTLETSINQRGCCQFQTFASKNERRSYSIKQAEVNHLIEKMRPQLNAQGYVQVWNGPEHLQQII